MCQELAVRSDAGGLLSYRPRWKERYRLLGRYAAGKARRFAGHAPAKLELVINARTAKVLGLTVISCSPWPTRLSSKSSQPCTPFISAQGQQLAHADHPSCEGAASGIHVGCDRCACGKGLGGGTVSRQY